MAQMHPENFTDKGGDGPESERTVFNAIRQYLPNAWHVFYSLAINARNRHLPSVACTEVGSDSLDAYTLQARQDHEMDFVFYHPSRGIVVMEVKGGAITCHDNTWFQNDHACDPVKQVVSNKYFLLHLFERRFGGSFQLPVGCCVCFPDVAVNRSVRWPLEANGIVLTADLFPTMEQFLNQLLHHSTRANHTLPLAELHHQGRKGAYRHELKRYVAFGRNADTISSEKDILKFLMPTASPTVLAVGKLQQQIQDDVDKITIFDNTPLDALRAFRLFPRLVVRGCAGSGKTSLAIAKARECSRKGKTVLLLCYNVLLGEYLQRQVKDSTIKAGALFPFFCDLLKLTPQIVEKHRTNPKLYTRVLPTLIRQYLRKHPHPFDAVIVDEGQDFDAELWTVIKRLVSADGIFYIFYDPDQNIFHKKTDIPVFGDQPPAVLDVNYRNSKAVFDSYQKWLPAGHVSIPGGAASGAPTSFLNGATPERRRELLTIELNRIITEERVSADNIVVLGAHSLAHTCVGTDSHCGRWALCENPVLLGHNEIAYHTYMKFKGLEASVVILLDVDPADDKWRGWRGVYTAMTRAISHLVIISSIPWGPEMCTKLLK